MFFLASDSQFVSHFEKTQEIFFFSISLSIFNISLDTSLIVNVFPKARNECFKTPVRYSIQVSLRNIDLPEPLVRLWRSQLS